MKKDVRYLKNEYVADIEYPEGYTGDHILDFDNFSPNEMESILYGPLETRGSFHFGSELGDLDGVPILKHVMIYLEYLKDHSPLKLTQKGNLPLYFCNYLIGRDLLGDRYFLDLRHLLRSEEDSYYLNFMKLLLYHMGLSSKRFNSFSLSVKGKKFLKMEMSERYRILFTYLLTGYNWAYFDRNPESWTVQGGYIFSIFLFQKYGDMKRPPEFYTDRFRIAFPNLLRDFQGQRYGEPVSTYERCYLTRVIKRALHPLGLIDIEYKDEDKWEMISVRKTPLIDKVLTWKRDVFDFDREGYLREKEERLRHIEEKMLERKLSSKYAKKVLSRMDPGKQIDEQ